MLPDEEGFLQPVVDAAKCVHCGKCEVVCPVLHPGKPRKPLAVYAAKAKDDELRWGSASGGVFTVLAQDVLKRGGVVFGAGFERPTWRVIHKAATNEEELDDLRGSKYVQSDTGDTFKEAKSYLDAGREVLYSGCPCQVAALKSFLGTDYPNLLTVDLICHGVPSPWAWEKYLEDRIREFGGRKISRVLPRRYCVWQDFSIKLKIDGVPAATYCQNASNDAYMISFGRWWTLRECCYSCRFKRFRSGAAVTLGDYSGRYLSDSSVCDDLGVSVAFVNTDVGRRVWGAVASTMTIQDTDMTDVSRQNPCVRTSTVRSRLRNKFYECLRQMRFDDAVREVGKNRECGIVHHLLWWCKRLIVNFEWNHIQWT